MATMIQVSMIGFASGGAFLSLLYYDVPYYLMAAMVVTGVVVEKALGAKKAAVAEAAPRIAPADSPAAAGPVLLKKT
jgi:hypothetical protein